MTRVEIELGTIVPATAPMKFAHPETTFVLFFAIALIAVSTTCSTVC